jgi:hemolysin III
MFQSAIPQDAPVILRPLMRGTLHLAAAIVAPFGLVWLLIIADSPRGYVGAAIFASTLIALYVSSASYHLVPWPGRWHGIAKRLDHAMIFALIAGTYTPFCLIVLDNAWGITMLALVWTFAGAGMLLKIVWPYAPRWLSVGLYLGLGWIGIVPITEVVSRMDIAPLTLLLVGGALYTIGAVVYGLRRPDPFPRVFGFHEVFHVFVIAGSAVHFSVIAAFVLQ